MKELLLVLMFAMKIKGAVNDIDEVNTLRGYIDCYNVIIDYKNGDVMAAINDMQYVDEEYLHELIFNSKGN